MYKPMDCNMPAIFIPCVWRNKIKVNMKIKHLKEWLNTLPQELDEHDLVFRKIIPGDTENWLAHDKPITACGIDEGSNEAYFCDEVSHEVMKNS